MAEYLEIKDLTANRWYVCQMYNSSDPVLLLYVGHEVFENQAGSRFIFHGWVRYVFREMEASAK